MRMLLAELSEMSHLKNKKDKTRVVNIAELVSSIAFDKYFFGHYAKMKLSLINQVCLLS